MKKKIFIFSIIIFSVVGFVSAKEAIAGSGDNVYGWAWSENIGWISFNNITGGGVINYGVNIDSSTGLFSGYAWSENIGWISFDSTALTGCPGASCEARLSLTNAQVSGWARACAVFPAGFCSGALRPDSERGGWDGWIKLRDTNYGLWLNSISSTESEFRDWAWGGDDSDNEAIIGWISFNRSNTGASSDYRVMMGFSVNPLPSADSLGITPGNYCDCEINEVDDCSGSKSEPPILLKWTFKDPGDTQSAYQIEIHKNINYTSLAIDSGKVSSLSMEYVPSNLEFGTQYWWRLKVWDSQGAESGWINAPTFTTDSRWPNTVFSFEPKKPLEGDNVTFTDNSTCYVGETGCGDADYKWDFEYDGSFNPTYFLKEGATYTYNTTGKYIVRLEVTDIDDHMCPCVYPLTAALPLPTWKEIAPF